MKRILKKYQRQEKNLFMWQRDYTDRNIKGGIMNNRMFLWFVSMALIPIFGILTIQCAGLSFANSDLSAETQIWVSDWRQNIFQDTKIPSDGNMIVNLISAKNDIEPFQINIRSAKKAKVLEINFSDLVSNEGTILSGNCTYNFIDFIRSRTNSRYADETDSDAVPGDWDLKWVNLQNPIRTTSPDAITAFPEILSPARTREIKAGVTQPIWIKIHTPSDAAAGNYTGTIQIKTSLGEYEAKVSLEVVEITIPEPEAPDAFSLCIWSQLVGNFDTEIDVIEDAYRVKIDSPEWWAVMESFASLMKENRLNVLRVNQIDLLLQGKNTSVDKDGNIVFDWSFFNKFVSFFKERAGIQLFLGGPLAKYKANPRNYNNNIYGEETNDYTQSYIECIIQGKSGKPQEALFKVDIDELQGNDTVPGIAFVKKYAASLYQNLVVNNWLNIWGHSIIDEPGKRQSAALYPYLEKALSDNCPGIITGDAFTAWTAEEQAACTELYAIIENSYEELQEKVQGILEQDDIFWIYTSSVPIKNNYLNRTIDLPVWQMEMLGYLCFKRGATGYLHWGFNQWNTWTKDYQMFPDYPSEEMWENVLGDSSCVYPDRTSLTVRSSIRVEALREASEMYSILSIAEKIKPAEANAIIDLLIRSGYDYETDIEKISDARKQILLLAAGNNMPEE